MINLRQSEKTKHSPVDASIRQQNTDILRSKVRPYVTYLVVIGYLLSMCYAISWALNNNQVDNGLALISNLSAVAATIVGFWFGSRIPPTTHQAVQSIPLTLSAGKINLVNAENTMIRQGKTLLQLAQAIGLDTAEELNVLLRKPHRLTVEQRAIITQLTGLN